MEVRVFDAAHVGHRDLHVELRQWPELFERLDHGALSIPWDELAEKDVGDACDVLRPVWERTGGADGYVSLEVDPGLAYDTEATLEQALGGGEDYELVFTAPPSDLPNCASN